MPCPYAMIESIMLDSRNQPQIIPATTLRELYRNLQVTNGLAGKNLEYHVELHGAKIRDLENKILLSFLPNDTFFLAGQTGSGKTTAVDYLFSSSEGLKNGYRSLYIDFRDETNIDDKNFHIIEIILILIQKIIELTPNRTKKEYEEKIKKIEEQQLTSYVDTSQNQWSYADFIAEGLANIGLGWKLDASRRETVRRIYKTKVNDVLALLNDLAVDCSVLIGLPLLIFMDGLEKMRNEEAIENIFNTDTLNTFKNIQTRKIIATPVHLIHRDTMTNILGNFTSIQWKIRPNPLTYNILNLEEKEKADNLLKSNTDILRKSISVRMKNKSLIQEEALDLAVTFSGGLITDLLFILSDAVIAAVGAGSDVVRKNHVEDAIVTYGNQKAQAFALDGSSIKLLYQIYENNHLPSEGVSDTKLLIRQLLFNNIISNINNVPCYFVHPLIEEAVKVYGRSTKETPEAH